MNRILLVEDSPTQAYNTTLMLKRNGYEVIHVDNGQKALESALELAPDLVLMDVVMANGNGFETARLLSRNTSTQNIPVVMLSSKNQLSDILWARRQGAKDYLVKPVAEKELLTTINNLLTVK
jgi:twitching motility two-component system response regulator PilH